MSERMNWDLNETKRLILSLHGEEQLHLAWPSLQSLAERQLYAKFHYQEAGKLFTDFTKKKLINSSMIEIIFGNNEESLDNFQQTIKFIGAHLTACIQSIHSVPDILSYAIYYSLALNKNEHALVEEKIALHSVRNAVSKLKNAECLEALLRIWSEDKSLKHISGLANVSKHRSIVRPSLGERYKQGEEPTHEILLGSFTYRRKAYEQIEAHALLGPGFSACSNAVVATGRSLNEYLEKLRTI